MQDRNINPALALPENQATGGYTLYTLVSSFSNYMAISFNQTHTDPVKREIFRTRDFRIGMSHALNRPAMIAASGLDVEPRQVAPLEGTPWYSELMANQYLEYNVTLANEYLDRAGYSARDAAGFRLGPDGERIRITLMVSDPTPSADYSTYLPLIEADWEAVGVEVTVELVPRLDYEARSDANDFDVAVFLGEGGLDTLQAPRHMVPVLSPWSQQGILWSDWYSGSPSGEEPPAPVLAAQNLYRQISQTSDIDQQVELMRQMIAIITPEFHVIGLHEVPLTYGIIRPNFHNVPAFSFFASNYPNPSPTNPSQYFIDPQDD
jgi:peptide/nickel transport system substrate-binding protein